VNSILNQPVNQPSTGSWCAIQKVDSSSFIWSICLSRFSRFICQIASILQQSSTWRI